MTEIRIKYPNKIPVRAAPHSLWGSSLKTLWLDSEDHGSASLGAPVREVPKPPSPCLPVPVSPSSISSPLQVVVERYQKEKTLPPLNRTKFLVSQDLPLTQFAVTLR